MKRTKEERATYEVSKPEELHEQVVKRGWNWSPIPFALYKDKELSGTDRDVYGVYLYKQGKDASTFVGAEWVAEVLGYSTDTVSRSIARLIASNWMRRIRRRNRTAITFIFESKALCLKFDARRAKSGYRIRAESTYQDTASVRNHDTANLRHDTESQLQTSVLAATPQTFETAQPPTPTPTADQSASALVANHKATTAAAITHYLMANGGLDESLRRHLRLNLSARTKTNTEFKQWLKGEGATDQQIAHYARWWALVCDFQSHGGAVPPTTNKMRETWGAAMAWQDKTKPTPATTPAVPSFYDSLEKEFAK